RRVHCDNPLNGSSAYGAKRIMACEHDAVLLRAVVAVGFVVRTLERSHFGGIFVVRQQRVFVLLFVLKELVHLGFGAVLRAYLPALRLNGVLIIFELLLLPRGW